jgi:tetratricopeptide (TPR) repeat protein
MNEPHEPNRTVDEAPSAPADSLDAGLAAGFVAPRSSLGPAQRPLLLKEADGDSAHIVQPTSDAMPSAEQTGDRYQLQGEIARGGMGAGLRGRDVDLGRDLAVKVLLEKHADRPDVIQRFIEEAQIGGQLQHPGVVPVYDIGRFGDRPFFTMKLVKGLTLAAILAARADPAADRPRLLNVMLQVAQAIAYAHAKGVIHRDLKPANIMVGAFGEVQVMDWGLAKVLAEGGTADEERASRAHQPEEGTLIRTARSTGSAGSFGTDTEAGSLLGTPAYMPPEQAIGDIANLDRRADVFGLGAILCEVLTGKPPYVGRSSEEVRRKAANGDLADATARLDACGAEAELIALTKKCLSPEAIDRPRDAQAVADGLSAYLNGVQERLQTAQRERAVAMAREAEQRKRRKVQLALAAAVVALLLGGGAFAFWRNAQAQAGRERDARNAEAVAALLDQAQEALEAGDAAKAAVALEAAEKRAAEGGAEEQAQRLGRLESDLALLRELDAIDQSRWTVVDGKLPDQSAMATRTREALRRFGVDAEASADEAAARLSASVLRQRIVSALDRLLGLEQKAAVRALLRRVDAEPYRDAVRDAVLANDGAKMAGLAGRKAALEQPPGFVAFLGESREIPVARRRQLLQAAVSRRPGDLALLMTLGISYLFKQKEGADEGLRWLQAALAAAPANPIVITCLGLALQGQGKVEETIACYRKAIQLEPKLALTHTNLGAALAGKGQMEEAIACFRKAIQLDPKHALAHLAHTGLGSALERQGKEEEAIACYRKTIQLDPKFAPAHNSLANALYRKGQLEEALACSRKATLLDPKDAKAHNNLGNALEGKGQWDEAIASYHKALELDPKIVEAHTNLGNALLRKGQLDAAIASHRHAIALDPKLAAAHVNLGYALYHKGQLDEAIACFRKTIELNPKIVEAHTNLGTALLGQGQVDAAIACYKKAIALDPKVAGAHDSLGKALAGKGQMEEAIACFRKATLLDPKYALAHNHLGYALHRQGKVEEAIACFRKAIALDPKFAEAHSNLGRTLQGQGHVEEAIACYRKAVALDPKDAKAHTNLGTALAVKGQLEEAIACYRKAIALDPKFAGAHFILGLALKDKGKVEEAIACFRKATLLDPKDALAHNNLGTALADKGQVDEAIACHKKALALDPKFAGARNDLARTQRLVAARDKVAALRKGSYTPASIAERLSIAEWCQIKKFHHTATGLYAAAFAAEPKLADDLKAAHRYHAARHAALAATGQGEDAGKLDDQKRTRLRTQALDWLRADLALHTRQLETGKPADRAAVQRPLRRWQKDTDLAGLRDKAALAKLPQDEQKAFTQFWADVAALLKKMEGKPK